MKSSNIKPIRSLAVALLLAVSASPMIAASVPRLTDTINPLPGAPCFNPLAMALNHSTKRAYVAESGYAGEFGANGRLSVIDVQTNTVIKNLSFQWDIYAVLVNENTNTVYLGTYTGKDGYSLTYSTVLLDGATNEIKTQINSGIPGRSVLDPTTGRIFGLQPYSVAVYDGTTLSKIQDISFDYRPGSGIAIDPASRKVYVTAYKDGFPNPTAIAVIDADALASSVVVTGGKGNVGAVTVDTALHRAYAVASVPDGNGGQTPAIFVLNGSSIVATIPLTVDDFDLLYQSGLIGAATDPAQHRAYFAVGGYPTHRSIVIDTQANSRLPDLHEYFSQGDVFRGKLYATQSTTIAASSWAKENSLGVVDLPSGSVTKIVTGYKPYALEVNTKTGRLYVADQQAGDLLAFDAGNHSLIARIPVGATDTSRITNDSGSRDLAVSESLNRIYLQRNVEAPPDSTTGYGSSVVDVVDGSANTVMASIKVSDEDLYHGFVAVDDVVGQLYVTGAPQNQPKLFVFKLSDHSLVATLPLPDAANDVAVNPVTGRVYVAGGARFGGNNVVIIDGKTNSVVTTVSAGAVPMQIAVNQKTNKIYIANNGAGSVDNSVTVIDGATDAVETTFSNTNANNGDAVAGVGINEATNTVYVSDNSNQYDATGRATFFDPAKSYAFLGQIELGHYPGRMAFDRVTKQMFVTNNYSGYISVLGSGVPPAPPAPPHGGLSATVFRVNGGSTATGNVADTALHFTAQQTGTPNGLKVRVQVNTAPNNEANDWVDLNNGSSGYMTVDKNTGQFVLTSTNYPLVNGIYFRALSTAPGYPDSKSNIIGPFNLAASQNHLGTTTLYMATNGGGQPINFRAVASTDQAGISFYVQSTLTPDDDSSWKPLDDGRGGQMYPFPDVKRAYLDSTSYPTGDPLYFRVVAKAVGFVDSFSNIVGVSHVVNGTPPTVNVYPSTLDQLQPGSGSGLSPSTPFILNTGSLKFTAQASSSDNKSFKRLALLFDGSVIDERGNGANSMNTDYGTNVAGDHVLKAFAVDERGVVGYADRIYLRILPPGGKVYKFVSSGGNWNDAKNWNDGLGGNGVPGANDAAVIENGTVTITSNVTVLSLSVISSNGASALSANGAKLTVTGNMLVHNGALSNVDLTIPSSSTMSFTGDNDVPVSGSITNYGTIKLTGKGGIAPVTGSTGAAMRNTGSGDEKAGLFDGIAAFIKNVGDFIFHRPAAKAAAPAPQSTPPPQKSRVVTAASFTNQGRLIGNDGASLIGNDGASLIGNDGASLIGNAGGTLIGNDGASLIGNDGASLIGNDGASLIGNDGASLIGNDGASLIGNDGASILVRNNAGNISPTARAATTLATYVQSGGTTDLTAVRILSPARLDGGVLTGQGAIVGDLTNNSGYISPGTGAGTLTVVGNFAQATGGTLIIEQGGATEGQSDLLTVTGSASLGGKIDIKAINGYKPDPADTFSPLSYSTATGSFSAVSSNATLTLNSNGALVTNNVSVAQPKSGQPLNISTRMEVLSGENVLIAGFIVTGPAGSTKKVLVRGLGPSLPVGSAALGDPLLEFHNADGTVTTNNDWQSSQASEIQATGVPPNNPKEAAIVLTVPVGSQGYSSCTAILKGAHGETGIGLVEVYDLDRSSPAKLANISTRGFIDTGDNVMIGGFIVGGGEPAKIFVRAVGPSLKQQNVSAAIDDPMLEVHDTNGAVIGNDNWRETQEAEIIATTIPPTSDKEPGIVQTLAPGNYTAIVRGKNGATGVGLVEAYNLQ